MCKSTKLLAALSIVTVMLITASGACGRADTNSSLAGWWRFDEGKGTIAHDASGNGNNVVMKEDWDNKFLLGRRVNQTCPEWTAEGLKFGPESSLHLSCSGGLGISREITLEAWVKFEQGGEGNLISSGKKAAHASGYYQLSVSWLKLIGELSPEERKALDEKKNDLPGGVSRPWNDSRVMCILSCKPSGDGEGWHHLVGTRGKDGIVRVYVDGERRGREVAFRWPIDDSGTLQIGGKTGYLPAFRGVVGEVRIYRRALAEEEVRLHYENGLALMNGRSAGAEKPGNCR